MQTVTGNKWVLLWSRHLRHVSGGDPSWSIMSRMTKIGKTGLTRRCYVIVFVIGNCFGPPLMQLRGKSGLPGWFRLRSSSQHPGSWSQHPGRRMLGPERWTSGGSEQGLQFPWEGITEDTNVAITLISGRFCQSCFAPRVPTEGDCLPEATCTQLRGAICCEERSWFIAKI